MSGNDPFEAMLARYQQETAMAVVPPGPAAVRRAVGRRQRRRLVLAGVLALVAVTTAIGLGQRAAQPGPAAPNPPLPSQSMVRPDRNVTGQPNPPVLSRSVGGPDLQVAGPSTITMTADGTVYRGQLVAIVKNTGEPYGETILLLTLPTGVSADPNAAGCTVPPPPATMRCYLPSIPAGGTVEVTIPLVADYAPRPDIFVLGWIEAQFLPDPSGIADPTPADNAVRSTLRLVPS